MSGVLSTTKKMSLYFSLLSKIYSASGAPIIMLVCLFLSLITACTHKPTRGYTDFNIDTLMLERTTRQPLQITEETVVVDVRKRFDYSMAHIPKSQHLDWADFVDGKGSLKKDLSSEVRRLALMGLSPRVPVVVVGNGYNGNGEEGRMAWLLLYLGFHQVQTSELSALGMRFSNVETPPIKNEKVWQPNFRDSLVVENEELVRVISAKRDGQTHIIDVRSEREYFSKNKRLQYELPDVGATHIEWKNFYTETGRPNFNIKTELQNIAIHPSHRIIVICDNGQRSAAVTYALLALGYHKVGVYLGGYRQLIAR